MPLDLKKVSVADFVTALEAIQNGSSGGSTRTRTKAVSSTPTATMMHGPGGLFALPCMTNPVFSAMGLPGRGLESRLPIRPSRFTDPTFAILTGMTASSGSQPAQDASCPDYPQVGKLKRCTQSYPFGRKGLSTEVIDITKVGQLTNECERTDLRLVGSPFSSDMGTGTTGVPKLLGNMTPANILNDEIASKMWTLGVGFQRDFAGLIYTAQAATDGFYGLQYLVNAGYRDSISGQRCEAADSLVINFGNGNVSLGTGSGIVRQLVYAWRNRKNIAKHIGVPVDFAWVMREELFYELTEIWPCTYYTNRCTTNGNTNFTNAKDMTDMRDAMREGEFLWMDGLKLDVILDDSLPETEPATGQFTSDIFLLPLTFGGEISTYLEYYDYTPAAAAANMLGNTFKPVQAADNGRFLIIYKTPTNTCIQVQAEFQTRLILRAPFLSARVYNVRYSPLIHNHEYQPGGTYFYDGGLTDTAGLAQPIYSPIA